MKISKYRIRRDQVKWNVSNNRIYHLLALVEPVNHNNLLLKKETHLNLRPLRVNTRSSLLLKRASTKVHRLVELLLPTLRHHNIHQVNGKMMFYLLQILRHHLMQKVLRALHTSNLVRRVLKHYTSILSNFSWQGRVQRLRLHHFYLQQCPRCEQVWPQNFDYPPKQEK